MGYVIVVAVTEPGSVSAYDVVPGGGLSLRATSALDATLTPSQLEPWISGVLNVIGMTVQQYGNLPDGVRIEPSTDADGPAALALLGALEARGERHAEVTSVPGSSPTHTVQWVVDEAPARRRPRSQWLVAGAVIIAALLAGTGVGVVRALSSKTDAQPPVIAGGSQAAPPPSATSIPATPSTAPAPKPAGPTLGTDQLVVPRGVGTDGRLYLVRATGARKVQRLPTPKEHRVNGPTLSKDRRRLLYLDRTANTVRSIGVDGANDRVLFTGRATGCNLIGHLSWSPADENTMVLECGSPSGRSRLQVVDDRGSLVRKLRIDRSRVRDPVISPDGRTVAFWAANGKATGGAIYTMPLDGSARPVRLTADRARDADPAWSPDGQQIAFSRRGGRSNLDVYLMSSKGRGEHRLIGGRRIEEKPVWSPDGKQVAIISDRRAKAAGASFDVYVIETDGRGLRALGLTTRDMSTPAWALR